MTLIILQEHSAFKKFGDSLLSRKSKISDLVSSLESYKGGDTKDSDVARLEKPSPQNSNYPPCVRSMQSPLLKSVPAMRPCRSVKALDVAEKVLEEEYEKIAKVKADTSRLLHKLPQDEEKKFPS